MGRIFTDYDIPEGYKGVLYSGDVFFYYEGDALEYASGAALSEGDPEVALWYEDLDECIFFFADIDWDRCFEYPHHDYDYARVVIDGIVLDGTEEPGQTGWDCGRLDETAFLGPLIENPEIDR